MTVAVFAGPSICNVAGGVLDSFTILPPAACGDVARVVRDGASTIALIDGLFETTASVWHKELLWAMSKGVRVFGSSSMGALRAAEMWPFGMQGVGAVYRLYRRNSIIDDDEVAQLHGPPETGSIPVTEAMVNIRLTLRSARRSLLITLDAERAVAQVAKSLFYKDRTYEHILELAERKHGFAKEVYVLRQALKAIRRDVKRDDAVLLLSRLHYLAATPPAGARPQFQGTSFWDIFVREQLSQKL